MWRMRAVGCISPVRSLALRRGLDSRARRTQAPESKSREFFCLSASLRGAMMSIIQYPASTLRVRSRAIQPSEIPPELLRWVEKFCEWEGVGRFGVRGCFGGTPFGVAVGGGEVPTGSRRSPGAGKRACVGRRVGAGRGSLLVRVTQSR